MKTRKLIFKTDKDREAFPFIYSGFLVGGNSPQPKGMEVYRREVRILDKLEAVSQEHPETGERSLLPGEHTVELTQPEYELVVKHFESTPWTTKVVRSVVTVSDWLAAIPLEETEANSGG